MNLSQAVAGGSRNVNTARVFFPALVNSGTSAESSTPSSTSAYGWKMAYINRIWDEDGPKGAAAKAVLAVLWKHSDQDGRTWLGLPLLAKKAGLGNVRTTRNALERLVQEGWLWYGHQTWASLTAEQKAAGRPVPRRSNGGQAPNLYVLKDGRGQPVTSTSPSSQPARPGLVRTSHDEPSETVVGLNSPGGSESNSPGGGRAKQPYDPDLSGTRSQEVSAEGAAGAPNSTHIFSKAQDSKGDWGWLEAWNLLVKVHDEKTTKVYGVRPLPPDLKRDERKAVAECLDGVALELAATLGARGIERELAQVRQDLAARVMSLYFKRDNEHLRRVKHALRDLPREFHARIIEAKQALLRESHDAAPPRRAPVLELEQTPVDGDVQKAVKSAQSAPAEKPMRFEDTKALAQKTREMLDASTPKEVERPKSTEPKLEPKQALPVRAQESVQEPANASPPVQRSLGRTGAPRWGAMPPAPTKVRSVSRLQLSEPEESMQDPEPHPRE